jgi:hypothetical protein
MLEFVVQNWEGIMAVTASILSLAAVVVKLTPSTKDDEVLAKISLIFEVIKDIKAKDKQLESAKNTKSDN